jgi:hypothetical protein
MAVSQAALFIDDDEGRHPPELAELDLLPVKPGDIVARVGNAGEGHFVFNPEISKRFNVLRPHGDDLRLAVGEFSVVPAQLCHVPSAVGSPEAPVEHQDDVFFTLIAREFYRPAGGVGRGEIGRGGTLLRFYRHIRLF